jgi:hypothetical protein
MAGRIAHPAPLSQVLFQVRPCPVLAGEMSFQKISYQARWRLETSVSAPFFSVLVLAHKCFAHDIVEGVLPNCQAIRLNLDTLSNNWG